MKYIYKHGSQYWYQRAIPKKISNVLGKKTLKVSLKTNNIMTASKRAKLQALEHKKMFADINKKSKGYINKMLGKISFNTDKYSISFTEDYEDSFSKLLFNKKELLNVLVAQNKEKNVKVNFVDLIVNNEKVPRLSKVFDEYLNIKNVLEDKKRKASIKKSLSRMIQICGDKKISEYSSLDALSFRDHFIKLNKISTGKRNQSNLQNLFSVIFNKYSIEKKNPFSKLIWPESKREYYRREFSREELNKIKEFISTRNSIENLICGLLFNTGCSFNEIIGLTNEDVNLNKYNPYIVIRSNSIRSIKNIYKRRVLPLVGISYDSIKKIKTNEKNIHLFVDFFRNNTCNFIHIENKLNTIIKEITNGKTCISFKYSLIERLKEIGCPQEIISEMIGMSKKEFFYRSELNLDVKASWLKQI